MKSTSRKMIVPAVATLTLLVYAAPTFAYTSVTATASITFSNYSTYYKAIGKGHVKASGSSKTGQRIDNYTVLQHNESYMDIEDISDDTSPVIATITSGKEGDDLTWYCSVIGTLWEGELLDSDEDDVTKKYSFS